MKNKIYIYIYRPLKSPLEVEIVTGLVAEAKGRLVGLVEPEKPVALALEELET